MFNGQAIQQTEEIAMRLMRVLEAPPAANQRRVAERSGMSPGSPSYCHKALMPKGLVKMQNFSQSPNKLGYVFLMIPCGVSEKADLTPRYPVCKSNEYVALKTKTEALQAEALHGQVNSLRKQNQ